MSVGRYWILTIPHNDFTPYHPTGIQYLRGQLERGTLAGYLHWQILVVFAKNVRLAALTKYFGTGIHAELTRSAAADEYVWKADTRVDGTQFEFGERLVRRNVKRDWESVWDAAKSGQLTDIDASLRICHYRTLKQIRVDHLAPVALERTVYVFWGGTGTGKSRRAWSEATLNAYPKDPRTKFWDGYAGHENVVIDEFRGDIDIAHLLRWFDRYPVIVEVKGSSVVFAAQRIWITSNLSPEQWFPGVDRETMAALKRRLIVTHFIEPLQSPK